MVKIYQPPKKKEDLVKDEQGFTENDVENAVKLISQVRVKKHESWKKSEHYEHVMEIIDEWVKEMASTTQFTPEALATATSDQVKEIMVIATKCQVEAEKLKKRLS